MLAMRLTFSIVAAALYVAAPTPADAEQRRPSLRTSVQEHGARNAHHLTSADDPQKPRERSCAQKVCRGAAIGAAVGAGVGAILSGTTAGNAAAGAVYGAFVFSFWRSLVGLANCF